MERQTMIAAQRRSVEKMVKSRRFWMGKFVKIQRQIADFTPKTRFETQKRFLNKPTLHQTLNPQRACKTAKIHLQIVDFEPQKKSWNQ